MRLITFFFFYISCLSACSQRSANSPIVPTIDTLQYTLGQTPITLTLRTYTAPTALFFIHLHDNENTAKSTVMDLLAQEGGQFLSIENNLQRNISFQLNGELFTFDPNRIFSDTGIVSTLKLLSTHDTAALRVIKDFATFVLYKIPDTALVAAVHNNTNANFSIASYQTAPLSNEALAVTINSKKDIDDFILTTDSSIFHYYQQKNHNAVLQRPNNLPDDGSLSIFFGGKSKRYINIEAEHGHASQQRLLLKELFTFLHSEKKNLPENK